VSEPAQSLALQASRSVAHAAPAGPDDCADDAADDTCLDQHDNPPPEQQLLKRVRLKGRGKSQQLESGTNSCTETSSSGSGRGSDQGAWMGQRARKLTGQMAGAPEGPDEGPRWARFAQPGPYGCVWRHQLSGKVLGAAAAAVAAVGVWWLWEHVMQSLQPS
jgi:hypothetical protein